MPNVKSKGFIEIRFVQDEYFCVFATHWTLTWVTWSLKCVHVLHAYTH